MDEETDLNDMTGTPMVSGLPEADPVSMWPGWAGINSAWPPGTLPPDAPTAGTITPGNAYQFLAGGGPKWAGPDANPGGPDRDHPFESGRFQIFGTM